MEAGSYNSTNRDIFRNDADITWSTTEEPFTPEEEDAILTIVIVAIGVIIAIVALFCMGIFIDCRETKSDLAKRRHPLRLKMPPIGRRRRNRESINDDSRTLATDMCPNGSSNPGPSDIDVIV